MKLNNINKKQAGLTLIEITLVIAVLLGLISVLFIGVKAYKEGSDRSKCILTISSVQKSVRSYQNLYELNEGDTLATTDIIGSGKMIEALPVCGAYSTPATDPPASGSIGASGYELGSAGAAVPGTGVQWLLCSTKDGTDADSHTPKSTTGW